MRMDMSILNSNKFYFLGKSKGKLPNKNVCYTIYVYRRASNTYDFVAVINTIVIKKNYIENFDKNVTFLTQWLFVFFFFVSFLHKNFQAVLYNKNIFKIL